MLEHVNLNHLSNLINHIETPAFILDEDIIMQAMSIVDHIKIKTGCKVLYALKPLVNRDVMRLMAPHVNGFAASSLFEATISKEVIANNGSVHITTPGFRPDEMDKLAEICDYISLNSLNQYARFHEKLSDKTKLGLRINPQLPFVKDRRYNPCRKNSKLGIPLKQIVKLIEEEPRALADITGIHFHTNCDATSFVPLFRTIQHFMSSLDRLLPRLTWLNMGGGYLLQKPVELEPLFDAIAMIRAKYNFDIFFEPGAAMVRDAGFIIASVIDLMTNSDNTTIAVLDTSVNHMQEVFEYQFEPEVLGHNDNGSHWYTLVGSTCLAGDLFGEYCFDTPLEIGSKIVFSEMGAYTLVKAHMFNGVNQPNIYLKRGNELILRKRFTYQDFLSRAGD